MILLQLTDEETEAQTSDTIYVTAVSEHQDMNQRGLIPEPSLNAVGLTQVMPS